MMNNLLNGMFGKVGNGMCRLSMNGNIAVKTSSGYKTYNLKTGRLTNCDSFVFNIGEECKLRSNRMPVPLLRNGYSIFNGTKYR